MSRLRWFILTLPLAPLAATGYFFFEWLFFVTKPSSVSALPAGERVRILLASPLPLLLPLLLLQAAVSGASVAWYPRTRLFALLPAAIGGGALMFVLIDNFTYTLAGFNSLTAWGVAGVVAYSALVLALIALAFWNLNAWMTALAARRRAVTTAAAITAALAIASAITPLLRTEADTSAPPDAGVRSGFSRTDVPNILLIGIDGADAPAMSAYGYKRDTTPFLKRLSEESLFFENAFSNVGRTHGSLVAMLTGRLPFTTRVTFPPTILQGDDAYRHLLSVVKPLGYTTLQLGMRHFADAEDANLIGFDAANYRWQQIEDVRAGGGAVDQVDVFRTAVVERFGDRAGRLFGAASAIDSFAHIEGKKNTPYWSDDRRVETLVRYFDVAPEPWLVHAHLLDTHCCNYRPKELLFPEEPSLARRAHDSQLRETDGQLERLIGALKAGGRLDRTIVVISSDHTARWTTKGRVPLIIRFPNATPRGRVAANTQLVDVAPTILDAIGLDVPTWMDGVSLLDHEALPPHRPIFGVSDVAKREPVAPYLTALAAASPPNYGAVTVTLVLGSRWFELNLIDGETSSGQITGHTGSDAAAVDDETAHAMLLAKIQSAGLRVGTQP